MIKNWPLLGVALVAAGCVEAARADNDGAYQGVLELEETVLAFEVGGRLEQLAVDEGDRVEPGALIARLDARLVRAARVARALEAEAAQARADLVDAGARREDITALKARVRAALATEGSLEKDLERHRALHASGAVARASLDDVEGRYVRARSERESLEAELAALQRGARREERASAGAQAEAAKAALEIEDARLERHVLHAGQRARVLDVHVELGEVVGAGTPIVTLGDTRRPYVDVFVPQGALSGIDVGDRAELRVDSEERSFRGTVEHIARRTEFTPRFLFSPRERPNLVVRVRVRVDDPDERLHAGVPAFVTIERGAPGGRTKAP